MSAERGFRADTIAPTQSAAASLEGAGRVLEVIERADGTAVVHGMRTVFDTLELAHAAALESIYCADSSYYLAAVKVVRLEDAARVRLELEEVRRGAYSSACAECYPLGLTAPTMGAQWCAHRGWHDIREGGAK